MKEETGVKQFVLLDKKDILDDYYLAHLSRSLSELGKKVVLNGSATFGVFGDGKEIVQLAMAKQFKEGDWRAGYYRDQTFMLATGMLTPVEFFAQVYGVTDESLYPRVTGRSCNNHFATATIDKDGHWLNLARQKNSSADLSPTASQMPRLLGLAYASKLFKNVDFLRSQDHLSTNGNEVAFGSIGDSATSEGLFFETINAACVLQVPMAMSVFDDGYGISVPVNLQTAKSSISEVLKGFERQNEGDKGCVILKAKGWDYPGLMEVYQKGINICRKEHVPVIFHVDELTQPLGHSTSGSHERYKSKERLNWEANHDPLLKMKQWLVREGFSQDELEKLEQQALEEAHEARKEAWNLYIKPIQKAKDELLNILDEYFRSQVNGNLHQYKLFKKQTVVTRQEVLDFARAINIHVESPVTKQRLQDWIDTQTRVGNADFSSSLVPGFDKNPGGNTAPLYSDNARLVKGSIVLRENFHALFEKYPGLVTFGEDTGKLGDVNRTLAGLQEKYGEYRVTDTGIREATIIGQGIGLALRGIRAIAEIQYLDYLMYALQIMSDDLASIHYRTAGRQVAPLIVRTRGHRLVGMFHAGSNLGTILNAARGMHVCVPRDLTNASGMYNALLKGNTPALVIEPLKAYQQKEFLPVNHGDYTVEPGVVELLNEGKDVTLVTYGWCAIIARQAVEELEEHGISVELIDIRTLLPFDTGSVIKKSIEKTNHLVLLDEDVPGGATAFMLQKILNEQQAFYHLDAPPVTITSKEHRPSYSTDGEYFSKPGVRDVVEEIGKLMFERFPGKFRKFSK